MEERHVRGDPAAEQLVDEAVVEVEPRCVDGPAACRNDPRPRDREPKRVEAELAHQRDVLAVAVVEVAGDCSVVAVPHLARASRRTDPTRFRRGRPRSSLLRSGTTRLLLPRRSPTGMFCPVGWASEFLSDGFGRSGDVAPRALRRACCDELGSDGPADVDLRAGSDPGSGSRPVGRRQRPRGPCGWRSARARRLPDPAPSRAAAGCTGGAAPGAPARTAPPRRSGLRTSRARCRRRTARWQDRA